MRVHQQYDNAQRDFSIFFAFASPSSAATLRQNSPYYDDPMYVSPPPLPHKVLTVGYLRMSGVDDEAFLAGYLATIRDANIKNNAAPSGDRNMGGGRGSRLGFTGMSMIWWACHLSRGFSSRSSQFVIKLKNKSLKCGFAVENPHAFNSHLPSHLRSAWLV